MHSDATSMTDCADAERFGRSALAFSGGVVALVALVVMLVASALGGALGSRYHTRIDRAAGILT